MGQTLTHMKPEMIEMATSNPLLLQTLGMKSTTIEANYTGRYDHAPIPKTALDELINTPGFKFPQGLVYDKKSAIQYNIIKEQNTQIEQQLEKMPSEFRESQKIRDYVSRCLLSQNPDTEVTSVMISEATTELWKRLSIQEKKGTLGAITGEINTDRQPQKDTSDTDEIQFYENQEDPNNRKDVKDAPPDARYIFETNKGNSQQGVQLNISRL